MYWLFQDESQQAQAMNKLLNRARAPALPANLVGDKPTDDFFGMIDHLGVLSRGEQILIRLALDMWNGKGGVMVSELFDLDEHNLALVLGLLQAMSAGPQAIEKWITHAG